MRYTEGFMVCKVCGTKINDRITKCPGCGARIYPNINSNEKHNAFNKGKLNKRKKIIVITGCVFIIFIFVKFIGIKNNSLTNSEREVVNSKYARIECSDLGKLSDFEYELLTDGEELIAEMIGIPYSNDKLNFFTKKTEDVSAEKYVEKWLRKNKELSGNSSFQITLYRHYFSEIDNDGWIFQTRYSRLENKFEHSVRRFEK